MKTGIEGEIFNNFISKVLNFGKDLKSSATIYSPQ